jgi:hypothetical protein
MPKRAKAKKSKRASAKPAKRPVKLAKVEPTYLRGEDPVHIPVHRVMDVLKMIDDHGHSSKFKRQAKAAGVAMTLHPKTVNFVKDFVANNNMHAHAVGKQVVNSNGTYDCTND